MVPPLRRGEGERAEPPAGQKDDEQGIPEHHVDYCLPGGENCKRLTILVVVERRSKMKKAIAVPPKESTGRFAARKVLDLIR